MSRTRIERTESRQAASVPNRTSLARGRRSASLGVSRESNRMNTIPLQHRDGNVFVELGGELLLLDTGAPTSFGTSRGFSIAGKQIRLGMTYRGLTAATLSQFVGVPCAGLLGADVLGRFDHIIDATAGTLSVSTAELSQSGQSVRLDEFMGIPIVSARIGSSDYRMFFDTGAQISYFQDDSLAEFPPAGCVTDFSRLWSVSDQHTRRPGVARRHRIQSPMWHAARIAGHVLDDGIHEGHRR